MVSLRNIAMTEVTHSTRLRAGDAYVGRCDTDILVAMRAGDLTAIPVPASAQHNRHP